jgi:hypothetical protein
MQVLSILLTGFMFTGHGIGSTEYHLSIIVWFIKDLTVVFTDLYATHSTDPMYKITGILLLNDGDHMPQLMGALDLRYHAGTGSLQETQMKEELPRTIIEGMERELQQEMNSRDKTHSEMMADPPEPAELVVTLEL